LGEGKNLQGKPLGKRRFMMAGILAIMATPDLFEFDISDTAL
jgi:hypothetical protein